MRKNDLIWEFGEPLQKENALENFEINFVYKILPEIKTLLQKHNCAYPSKDTFDKPKKGMVFAHLLSFNQDSGESVFFFLDNFKNGGKLMALPFGTDGFGNLICERDGRIYFWSHETDQMELVAESLDDFLAMLHD